MAFRNGNRRRLRRRKYFRIWDWLLTLVLFGLIFYATNWLTSRNPQQFDGRFYVADGDTLISNDQKLRLAGIDAPEMGQICYRKSQPWNCGRESRKALRRLTRGKEVQCKSGETDRYDRPLVTCTALGENINSTMVREGWAVDYGGYAQEEGEARRAQRGIWAGDFEYPQEWRRANRGDLSGSEQAGDSQSVLQSAQTRFMDGWHRFKKWVRRIDRNQVHK